MNDKSKSWCVWFTLMGAETILCLASDRSQFPRLARPPKKFSIPTGLPKANLVTSQIKRFLILLWLLRLLILPECNEFLLSMILEKSNISAYQIFFYVAQACFFWFFAFQPKRRKQYYTTPTSHNQTPLTSLGFLIRL